MTSGATEHCFMKGHVFVFHLHLFHVQAHKQHNAFLLMALRYYVDWLVMHKEVDYSADKGREEGDCCQANID